MDQAIIDFLIKAKRATYAGKGNEVASSRPSSHDLRYKEGNLEYIDTYLGGKKFIGQEALWKDGIPFWSMNYMGRELANGFSIDFLKDALYAVKRDMPYRGPAEYKDGSYLYKCNTDGVFEWFVGHEEIFNNGNKIYECIFHGGEVC